MIALVFLLCIELCFAYEGLGVTLSIDQQDNVEIFSITESTISDNFAEGYKYIFYNGAGKEIGKGKSQVDFWISFEKVNTTYFSTQVTGSNVGELVIYNLDEKEIFRENIGELVCNNDGDCDEFENYGFCESDCDADGRDDYCNKERNAICDPDCGQRDIDCTCGNGVCDQNENYYRGSCPEDCGELITHDESKKETQPKTPKPRTKSKDNRGIILIISIVTMVLASCGLIYVIARHKK